MTYLAQQSILITGGTGSFGKAFIRHALEHLDPRRLIVYSRDELKQFQIRELFDNDPRLRYFIGDVRDADRLRRAMDGVTAVVHAAAIKQVDTAEYNPFEAIKTNILGGENVVNAALDSGVERVIALSTDKASSPVNLYGATKLCSDKLFIAANHYAAHSSASFSVVRYGNVVGSRGSVIPLFQRMAKSGTIPITDPRMTRFWITLPQAVEFVISSFDRMIGGELYVPKIPSMKLIDLAKAIAPDCEHEIIGIRPGEKLHEEMISIDDARRTAEFDDHYVIYPVLSSWGAAYPEVERVPDGFSYTSDTNREWLTVDDLRDMVKLL